MNQVLLKAAGTYIQNGISVIVTDGSKRSLYQWKEYQSKIIDRATFISHLSHPKAEGIAIVCGSVSGGLEVVDVDLKYDLTGELWNKLKEAITQAGLYDKLKIAKTKSGGYHLYYKCEVIEGNQKLAMRPPTDEEKKANPTTKHVVLIETRGEAGYVVAPPAAGYEWVTGKVTILSIDEREQLLSICRSFNEFFEQAVTHTPREYTKTYGLSPFEDYNKRGDVVALLQKHGWTVVRETNEKVIFKRPGTTDSKSSGDYNKQSNWFSVFTTNSCFEPNKAYQPYAVYAMLECGFDFKKAAQKLLDEGYGEKKQNFGSKLEREVFKRKQDGATKETLISYVKQSENKSEEEAAQIVDTLEKQWGPSLQTFWDVKIEEGKVTKININRTRLMNFLKEVGGFFIYFYDKNSTLFKLVRLQDGFIEESSSQQCKDFIKQYIHGLPDSFDGGVTPDDLMEVILKGSSTYFSDSFFEFFEPLDPDFLKSTKDINYFPFRNGVVVIDKHDVKLSSYGSLNKVVWKSRVIDFDITINQDFEPDSCEYFRFINCICGNEEQRRSYALTLIGYLLHTFKDAAKPWAVILAEETDNDKDGGGTGKGIFVKAISYLIRTVKLDGKNFDIGKTFSMQRVSLDTQLISIEDCAKGLDFEKFNSQITEGSTIEKKNKDELFIDYKDSPKFIFSTNYMLNLKGNHGKRRSRVFEFAAFFGPHNTPLDFFGHLMFDDWDNDEWNRFYNLMFFCSSLYLQAGLKQPEQTDKLKKKQVKVNFGEEFLDYFDNLIEENKGWLNFNNEYTNFINSNQWDKRDYSNKRFKKALQDSADLFGYKYEQQRNWQNNGVVEFKVK